MGYLPSPSTTSSISKPVTSTTSSLSHFQFPSAAPQPTSPLISGTSLLGSARLVNPGITPNTTESLAPSQTRTDATNLPLHPAFPTPTAISTSNTPTAALSSHHDVAERGPAAVSPAGVSPAAAVALAAYQANMNTAVNHILLHQQQSLIQQQEHIMRQLSHPTTTNIITTNSSSPTAMYTSTTALLRTSSQSTQPAVSAPAKSPQEELGIIAPPPVSTPPSTTLMPITPPAIPVVVRPVTR